MTYPSVTGLLRQSSHGHLYHDSRMNNISLPLTQMYSGISTSQHNHNHHHHQQQPITNMNSVKDHSTSGNHSATASYQLGLDFGINPAFDASHMLFQQGHSYDGFQHTAMHPALPDLRRLPAHSNPATPVAAMTPQQYFSLPQQQQSAHGLGIIQKQHSFTIDNAATSFSSRLSPPPMPKSQSSVSNAKVKNSKSSSSARFEVRGVNSAGRHNLPSPPPSATFNPASPPACSVPNTTTTSATATASRRAAKRPASSMASGQCNSDDDDEAPSPRAKAARTARSVEDFSGIVKSRLQSYSRTGQACDRCKVSFSGFSFSFLSFFSSFFSLIVFFSHANNQVGPQDSMRCPP